MPIGPHSSLAATPQGVRIESESGRVIVWGKPENEAMEPDSSMCRENLPTKVVYHSGTRTAGKSLMCQDCGFVYRSPFEDMEKK